MMGVEHTHFVIRLFSTWEDGEQKDLGLGAVFMELGDDGLDAFSRFLGLLHVVTCIVSTDHDDRCLGFKLGEFAVVETPKDVLCFIAREADVEWLALGVVFLPDGFAVVFPTVGNRVANEEEFTFGTLGGCDFLFVALFPPTRLEFVSRSVG